MKGGSRGVSPVIGTIIMVAVVVILASVISVFVLDLGPGGQPPAPQISVSHDLVDDGTGDKTIAVTLESGESVNTDQLYVGGSKNLDIGGPPGSGGEAANEDYASSLEKFTESSDGSPQVAIGDTWDSGETIYLDPVDDAAGVTIRIYWNTEPVEGVNPGTVKGEDSYKIAEFTA
jgi:flagellin-like protein